MPKKSIILGSLVVIAIIGILLAIFYNEIALSYAISKNNYESADRILSSSDISDAKIRQIISRDEPLIDEHMAQVIAQNCFGNTKRYETLKYLSEKKGNELLIDGAHAIFSCLKTDNIDWKAANIMLSNISNANITDQNGTSLLSVSLNATNGYTTDDVKKYLDMLFSKDINRLQELNTMKNIIANTTITDEQILQVLKDGDFSLNNDITEMITKYSIEDARRYDVLKYICNKQKGDITIDGEKAIFKCLDSEKPNWEAATILLQNLSNANIVDGNDVCLLSRSIIAANTSTEENISKYFDTLYAKDINFKVEEKSGNKPVHYAFKYGNIEVMNMLFVYIINWASRVEADGSLEDCLNVVNNDGLLPWELSKSDISAAVKCLINYEWSYTAIEVASYGMQNGLIGIDACISIINECEKLSSSSEKDRDYVNAIEYCAREIDFINYASTLATTENEKKELDNQLKKVYLKKGQLTTLYKESITPKDSNGKELYLGANVGLNKGIMYIGQITEFNTDKLKAKVTFYAKTDYIGNIINYTDEEKNNIFSQTLFGVPTDGWYNVSDLILLD